MNAKLRKWLRFGMWSSITLLVLSAIAVGVEYIRIHHWQWCSNLHFHDSWTKEERAALTQFDHYLRTQFEQDSYDELAGISSVLTHLTLSDSEAQDAAPSLDLWETTQLRIVAAYAAYHHAAPALEKLRHIIQCGHARNNEHFDTKYILNHTPTIFAAQMGQTEAIKALIAHGSDPNAIAYMKRDDDAEDCKIECETPLTPFLCGNGWRQKNRRPWEQRREICDFLVKHGANLNATKRIIGTVCSVALFQEANAAGPWLWALEHGKKVTGEEFNMLLSLSNSLEILQFILKEKRIDIQTIEGDEYTPLQQLMQKAGEPMNMEEFTALQISEKLDLLLKHGAGPNRCHSPATTEHTEVEPCADLPLDLFLFSIESHPDSDMTVQHKHIIEKMQAAGARSTRPIPTHIAGSS